MNDNGSNVLSASTRCGTGLLPAGGTAWLVAVSVLTSGGCAARNTDMLHFLREHEHEVSAIEYRIGIPDTIAVHAPKIVEIDGISRRLQPDGKITLQLLGEVKVVGMTAREIAAKLEVLLGRYYVDPKVAVRVQTFASKKFYVYGQARSTGPRPYTGRDTLLDAVLDSGIDNTSWTSRVTVRRPAHGDVPVRTLQLNIDNMLKKGDWSKNILLEPNDIVHIPATPVAWLTQRVQEVLAPVQPVMRAYAAPLDVKYVQDEYDNQDGTGGRRSRGGR